MQTFSALLAVWEGNPLVIGGFPSQRLEMQSFDIFFDLHLNKWLGKQSRRQWIDTQACSLWCYCNVMMVELLNLCKWKLLIFNTSRPVKIVQICQTTVSMHFVEMEIIRLRLTFVPEELLYKPQYNKLYPIKHASILVLILFFLVISSLIARFMGQHGAHLGPTGPRWASCWPHEICCLGLFVVYGACFNHLLPVWWSTFSFIFLNGSWCVCLIKWREIFWFFLPSFMFSFLT